MFHWHALMMISVNLQLKKFITTKWNPPSILNSSEEIRAEMNTRAETDLNIHLEEDNILLKLWHLNWNLRIYITLFNTTGFCK